MERLIAELSARFVTVSAAEVDRQIEHALALVADFAAVDRVTMLERREGDTFVRTHQWVRPGQPPLDRVDVQSSYPWGTWRVVQEREPLILTRLDDLPLEAAQDRASFEMLGVRSVAAFPLVIGLETIGAVSFATLEREREWPPDLVARLRLLAEIIAGVLARKQADLELRQMLTFERLIAELSASLVALPAAEIEPRIAEAVGQVATFLDLDRINIVERKDGVFVHRQQWVRDEAWRMPLVVPEEAVPWIAAEAAAGRPVIFSRVDDLPAEAERERELFARYGPRSSVMLPHVVGGTVVGAMTFGSIRRERTWTTAVVDRLRLFAELVANALARRQADLELERALAFEALMAELSATFVGLSADSIDAHVSEALARVAGLLDLDLGVVAQRAGSELGVSHQWVRDEAARLPSLTADAMPWLLGQLAAGTLIVFSRPAELPPEAEAERALMLRHGPRSAVFVPLMVGGEVVGAMALGSIRHERLWPVPVLDRLRLVAEIIGSALARKRADEELRLALDENEQLRARLAAENVYLREEVQSAHDFEDVVGQSAALRAVLHRVDQVASTDAPVLLVGETGTGKELIARAVHARSARRQHPLIAVNCAALPPSLVESELFGHEKGAFTGAQQARVGRFELADGSTLFLDEVGDLEPALQAKLLRALQGGEIQRVGSSKTIKVDVRVIAATNRDLARALRDGRFRADLYYRLSVFPLTIPPLRDRREDIPLLVWHFIQSRQRALGRHIERLDRETMQVLMSYDWPGNVRELQNVIERALILSHGPTLRIDDALRAPVTKPEVLSGPESLEDIERSHILDVLDRCRWTIEGPGQAAERLGLPPSTLRHRMQKLGVRRPGRSSAG